MSQAPMKEEDLLALSDEDILDMASAPETVSEAAPDEGSNAEGEPSDGVDPATTAAAAADDADDAGAVDDASGDAAGNAAEDTSGGVDNKETADTVKATEGDDAPGAENPLGGADETITEPTAGTDEADKGKTAAKADPKDAAATLKADKEVSDKTGDKAEAKADAPIDYKASYEQIMAPFKAAGKMVQINSPKDAIQLMQMGAHYTKKMQALQPNLKLLKMLENNDLLDESKISFLVDIHRKDPAAIQKLVKESGLDPLEIDTTADPAYQPGNHKVSDEEMSFTTTLEEVASDPVGKTLVVSINKTWDAASKEALWGDPGILKVLSEQKNNGIYDQISSEIERRRTLGYIGNEPFLQSYKNVGKELQAQGALTPQAATSKPDTVDPTGNPEGDQPGKSTGEPDPQRRVVETRPAQRSAPDNNERARAASPSQANPQKKRSSEFNPLALSDEDFEKNAELSRRL